ncbi:MAG: hypothetical protein HKL91_05370 [Candidatus Eremiobacteraeota bacterium]|nr:hypothetical protein [Candidatus Eremiobacteraeota bacterium]
MQTPEYASKLYADRRRAERTLDRLHAAGYGDDRIHVIENEADLPVDRNFESDTSPMAISGGFGDNGGVLGAATGATIGAVIAAASTAALIAATEGIAAPFVAGPVAATLAGASFGAVGGSIIGGLLELGAEADDWRVGVRNGGVAVIVTLKSHADRRLVRRALMH